MFHIISRQSYTPFRLNIPFFQIVACRAVRRLIHVATQDREIFMCVRSISMSLHYNSRLLFLLRDVIFDSLLFWIGVMVQTYFISICPRCEIASESQFSYGYRVCYGALDFRCASTNTSSSFFVRI